MTVIEFNPPLPASVGTKSLQDFIDLADSSDEFGVGISEGRARSKLVLKPPFQRGVVWSDEQKALLIDSMLRGVPVPELFVQYKTDSEGMQSTVVVDGQQRITACIHFVRGEFHLPDDSKFLDGCRGKKFTDLPDEYRKRLRSFKFAVRDLPDYLDEGQLRDIFRRLNTTVVSLNESELRNATYRNAFTRLIKNVAEDRILSDWGIFSPNDVRRLKHFEFCAEVFEAVSTKSFPNKKESLDSLYQRMADAVSNDEALTEFGRRFDRVREMLSEFTPRLKKTRFRNKSDAYSLLIYLLLRADYLDPSESADSLVKSIEDFSLKVSQVRSMRKSGSIATEAEDSTAVRYLDAVERAASDRLNRVRRDNALDLVLRDEIGDRPVPYTSEYDSQHSTTDSGYEFYEDIYDDDDEAVSNAAIDAAVEYLKGFAGESAFVIQEQFPRLKEFSRVAGLADLTVSSIEADNASLEWSVVEFHEETQEYVGVVSGLATLNASVSMNEPPDVDVDQLEDMCDSGEAVRVEAGVLHLVVEQDVQVDVRVAFRHAEVIS
ncbi:DUF262 domain-containing protein [Micrococcus sp. KRD096]|uniref:DUF262 domain-containing protein n=1 Tax=Micrococcus sp. KRD096 TaxID=2729721 RepID=UPI0019CFFA5A|nr:DUF262 domain-containing protein [Micrococcus sp. KRD096]